ncbi:putative ectonucleoside triphosphate diphosphohydrolase 6 isoform 2 [Scophthalmus maximus]|uniref:nucleoside diphosphate phosphatase n=1 Tax=Scophthalmus maximus TaxID=52904 RepID=A0A2U9CIM5_SCOMX|nr:ectonucleoside triphosphate diphosphohydrolase 6 [Scophthalmus maximus]XP_035462418.1 ectonucleoside triphosphate diphosphohydrolase 6 [Scophthalmus maximus]XP_035462419.1 ectonucleoside triphosphate diphosphohydrolase 6 [Scophthalmus maximus]XP_035462420.1 ectonucleoside triphosphate diphosphohydrolase 6 [Scophthalmus maximus]AWP14732.1 putative ectonucleoside triphosphate diphosphohydrolase 6 [Scophthalmus maximus]AWP14733.1 putative ectonucleoside triphosphate diphosphohydrolase 6 isofor
MKRPKLAGVFLFVSCLLVYLMFVKRHYAVFSPDAASPPSHHRHAAHQDADDTSASDAGRSFQYGIMFDAGSTGTRIHVFKFQIDDNEAPSLAHETFRAIKPGLSAYADDPEKCSSGILELLEVARSSVPASLWTRTPVVLKATAGLRLLPGDKASELLDQVRALFLQSPFLSGDDSVSIMDGTDEGISAWITVNFLTGGLHGADSPTVGMLDLGGGSTQITFSPQDEKTLQTSPIDYIRSFQMFNNTHTVYTHSYLGLGLMSARLAVLGGVDASPLGGSTELVSPCLAPEYSGSWEHADVVYTVKGQKAGEPVYEACLTKVEKVLYRKVMKASEAADVEFYAFSYYYDRAVDVGVIEEKDGGYIRVSDYTDAALRVCGGLSVSPQSPFLCLDLVYISVLLQELGFPPHKQFKLARTINQVETSWALGATFHYIESLKGH